MLLDSDVLIDLARDHPPADAWLKTLPTLPGVAGFAAMEFIQGVSNATELRQAQTFLETFQLVWPTEIDLMRALNEYMPLRLAHGIGLLDAIIAATATGLGETLATFNERHYRVIPGLVTVQPYKR